MCVATVQNASQMLKSLWIYHRTKPKLLRHLMQQNEGDDIY